MGRRDVPSGAMGAVRTGATIRCPSATVRPPAVPVRDGPWDPRGPAPSTRRGRLTRAGGAAGPASAPLPGAVRGGTSGAPEGPASPPASRSETSKAPAEAVRSGASAGPAESLSLSAGGRVSRRRREEELEEVAGGGPSAVTQPWLVRLDRLEGLGLVLRVRRREV